MTDYRKYLDPKVIASLDNIELKARLVVEGFITGLHRSPYHGFSVEFAEHRQYHAGDEIRHVDWKVYGRTEKFYIKQYEEETNLRSILAVDSSGSMKYASKGNISKFEYASYLAAAIAYMLFNQRDAVGLALYDSGLRTYLPPRSKQSYLHEVLKQIDGTIPGNITGTAQALDELAERIKRRGLITIFSDFFDDADSVIKALKHFRHRNHDVIVFHILDPREVDFKFGYAANFVDLETREEMVTQPYQLQRIYQKTLNDFIDTIRKNCHQHNIDYHLIDTSMPFDKALRDYLAKRNRM